MEQDRLADLKAVAVAVKKALGKHTAERRMWDEMVSAIETGKTRIDGVKISWTGHDFVGHTTEQDWHGLTSTHSATTMKGVVRKLHKFWKDLELEDGEWT